MKKIYQLIAFFTVLLFIFQGCFITNITNSSEEEDIVKSAKRIKEEFSYRNALERRSPLYSVHQTILKEITFEGDVSYKFFDVLRLEKEAYRLENTMYIILNKDEILPVELEYQESENSTSISKKEESIKEESITTLDSTEVSVITDYKQHIFKIVKVSYYIDNEYIDRMRSAKDIYFRYYAGPDMITTRMSHYDIRRLKRLLTRMSHYDIKRLKRLLNQSR